MLIMQPDPEDEVVPCRRAQNEAHRGPSAQDAGQVSEALVLHHDAALARNERLAFGRYAGFEAEGPGQTLVEDYVRLFRALVPKDTFMRSLPGVRARVRSIVLDRPDDALRTLESLAMMVGDEDAFGDLVKLYVLRRDMRNLVRSAERLFRMHSRIVVNPALSEELRAVALGERPQRPDSLPGRRFMEAYWRAAAPDDVTWGATVARRIADAGEVSRARELAEELAESAPDADSLGSLVTRIAAGNPDAEKLAVAMALKYFGRGIASSEFLDAAALACSYEPNKTLASKILEAPSARNLPVAALVPVLEAAEQYEDASQIVVEILAEMEPYEDVAPWLLAAWQRGERRDPTVRSAFTHRNGEMIEYLDNLGAQEA